MPDPDPDPATALQSVRAALHDLTNLLQQVIGPADLLALRPGVSGDPAAVAQLRALVAAGEAAIACVAELRRLTRDPVPLGARRGRARGAPGGRRPRAG